MSMWPGTSVFKSGEDVPACVITVVFGTLLAPMFSGLHYAHHRHHGHRTVRQDCAR
jgi:hypothetical protein